MSENNPNEIGMGPVQETLVDMNKKKHQFSCWKMWRLIIKIPFIKKDIQMISKYDICHL